MPIQKLRNGRMLTYYADGSQDDNPCKVRLGDGRLSVFFNGEESPADEEEYCGLEVSPGRFELTTIDGDRATLHLEVDNGEERLVGTFIWADGEEGTWEVQLLP